MELDNLGLAYLVLELQPALKDAFINKIQELRKNLFRFRLRTMQGQKDLCIALGEHKAVYFTEYKTEAPEQPHGFSLFLKKHFAGKQIHSIEQMDRERILKVSTKSAALYIELFAEGNLVAVEEGNILLPLRKEAFKDREVRKGIPYALPPRKGIAEFQVKDFKAAKDSTALQALMNTVGLAPYYAEEILAEAGVEKNCAVEKVQDKQWKSIAEKAGGLSKEQESKKRVNLILNQGKKVLVPVALRHFPAIREWESLSAALDEMLTPQLLEGTQEAPQENKKKKALAFSLEQQKKAIKRFSDEAAEAQQQGEALYENLHVLEPVFEEIRKAMKQGKTEKEIMESVRKAVEKGFLPAGMIQSVEVKKKKIRISLNKEA